MSQTKHAAIGGNVAQLRIRIAQLMGADIDKILTHLGVRMEELEDPELYLDAEFDNRVWEAIEQHTGNELVGASMAPFLQLSSMGLVGQAIMACDTIYQGLRSYVRYSKLLPLRDQVALIEQQDHLVFQLKLSNPLLPYSHHSISSFLGFVIFSLEQLSGQSMTIAQVGFQFDAPSDDKTLNRYKELFKTTSILFSQEVNWFSLENRYREVKNLAGNESSFAAIDRRIDQESVSDGSGTKNVAGASIELSQMVETYIRTHIGRTDITLKDLAQSFSMSERKLQNQLAQQKTSYSKLLSNVRQEMALELLKGPRLSVSDMAYLLGYQDINSFSRHFKKWHGISVSQYRKSFSRS